MAPGAPSVCASRAGPSWFARARATWRSAATFDMGDAGAGVQTCPTSMPFDPALDQTAHRPWPLPERPWVMTQSWHDLLFAHWRVDERVLRPLVPPAFDVDRFDGSAWLGIVPFTMTPRRAARGAGAALAVGVSRAERAHLRQPARRQARRVVLQPRRRARARGAGRARAVPAAVFRGRDARDAPTARRCTTAAGGGAARRCSRRRTSRPGRRSFRQRGTLEHFLTERYCLYHVDRLGRPSRLDIHHAPWRLRPARAAIARNTMTDGLGLRLEGTPLRARRRTPGRGGLVAQGHCAPEELGAR